MTMPVRDRGRRPRRGAGIRRYFFDSRGEHHPQIGLDLTGHLTTTAALPSTAVSIERDEFQSLWDESARARPAARRAVGRAVRRGEPVRTVAQATLAVQRAERLQRSVTSTSRTTMIAAGAFFAVAFVWRIVSEGWALTTITSAAVLATFIVSVPYRELLLRRARRAERLNRELLRGSGG